MRLCNSIPIIGIAITTPIPMKRNLSSKNSKNKY